MHDAKGTRMKTARQLRHEIDGLQRIIRLACDAVKEWQVDPSDSGTRAAMRRLDEALDAGAWYAVPPPPDRPEVQPSAVDAETLARTETLQRHAREAATACAHALGVDGALVLAFRKDLTYGIALDGGDARLDDVIAITLEALVALRRAAIAQHNARETEGG